MPDNFNNSDNNPQMPDKPKIKFNIPAFGDYSDNTSQTDSNELQQKDPSAPTSIPRMPDDDIPESPTTSSDPSAAPDYTQPQTEATAGSKKIRAFVKNVKHKESWLRTPNLTPYGATHVHTFHAKLTDESLAYMDTVINEWLEQHPECDVKFVSSTIGTFTGKVKEPALICQVWV